MPFSETQGRLDCRGKSTPNNSRHPGTAGAELQGALESSGTFRGASLTSAHSGPGPLALGPFTGAALQPLAQHSASSARRRGSQRDFQVSGGGLFLGLSVSEEGDAKDEIMARRLLRGLCNCAVCTHVHVTVYCMCTHVHSARGCAVCLCMHVSACGCVCTWLCGVHAHAYVCACGCVCARVAVCKCACAHVCGHGCVVCMHVCVHVAVSCACTCVCVWLCACVALWYDRQREGQRQNDRGREI